MIKWCDFSCANLYVLSRTQQRVIELVATNFNPYGHHQTKAIQILKKKGWIHVVHKMLINVIICYKP